jgi:hypothetical protein
MERHHRRNTQNNMDRATEFLTDRRENGDPDSKSEHGALIGLPKTICMPRVAKTLLVRNHTMTRSHSNMVRSPFPPIRIAGVAFATLQEYS